MNLVGLFIGLQHLNQLPKILIEMLRYLLRQLAGHHGQKGQYA
jgi:hypothetical protein